MKLKSHQSGYAVLLVTSVLLLLALTVSLASSKGTFFQIKVAQNELKARQAHWKAEGGLECFYSLLQVTGEISSATSLVSNQCKTPLALHALTLDPNKNMLSHPNPFTNTVVKKQITLSRGRATGALKSSTDLYVNGSSTFSTPDPGELSEDGWECVAIRYKNAFHSRTGADNKGVIDGLAPYADFIHQDSNCKASNRTDTSIDSGYGKDFIQDAHLEPFYDIFRESRSNWNSVKASWNFSTIDFDDITNQIVTDCGKKVADQIISGKTHIWVTGSCEFTSSGVDSDGKTVKGGTELIKEAFEATEGKPILLVVHNGIFAAHGTLSFPGMFYQLTTNTLTELDDHWESFEAKGHFGEITHFASLEKSNIVYLQRGSFNFSGGQVLDSPGYSAFFVNALDFAYNRDNLDDVIDPIIKFRWKKGSWNDL